MFKLILLAVLISACYAQTFPIKAVSVINGVIISPEAMQRMQQMQNMMQQGQMPQDPSQGMESGVTMIMGKVMFMQESINGPVKARVNITFTPALNGKRLRGLHIHTFGISSGSDNIAEVCGSTGPHFNPTATTHGSFNTPVRHVGDFGNVVESNGVVLTDMNIPNLQLFGNDNIVGRAVVLHEQIDDEGLGSSPNSKLNGDSGARIACGSIVYTN